MQQELDDADLRLEVRILGVNHLGHEDGDAQMCDGRTLPWLDEGPDFDVWSAWNAVYKDVIILGDDNSKIAVFNTTAFELDDPANYELLRTMLVAAAQ